jgi:hypothetical protein
VEFPWVAMQAMLISQLALNPSQYHSLKELEKTLAFFVYLTLHISIHNRVIQLTPPALSIVARLASYDTFVGSGVNLHRLL